MNIGSKTMFNNAVAIIEYIGRFTSPSALKIEDKTIGTIIKNIPANMIVPYIKLSSSAAPLPLMNIRISSKNNIIIIGNDNHGDY